MQTKENKYSMLNDFTAIFFIHIVLITITSTWLYICAIGSSSQITFSTVSREMQFNKENQIKQEGWQEQVKPTLAFFRVGRNDGSV